MLHSAKPFEVVLPWDPAFDPAHPDADYERFVRTQEPKWLRQRADSAPMVFHLRPLTHAQVSEHLAIQRTEDMQRCMAFLMSVVRVTRGTYRDGSTGDLESVLVAEAMDDDALRKHVLLWRPEQADRKFDYATVQHVGGVALTRAFFDSPWMSPPYRLPPTSHAVMNIYLQRLADAAKTSADAARSSERDAPEPQTASSEPGAAPGDVTATDSATSE